MRGTRLHRLVWKRNLVAISSHVTRFPESVNEQDHHGNTPLILAVKLAYPEVVRFLCLNGAEVRKTNAFGWHAAHEAFCSPYEEVAQVIYPYYRAEKDKTESSPENIFKTLSQMPDFDGIIRWRFDTAIPYVGRLLPNDEYHITKVGTTVRVDLSLIGFRHFLPVRGRMTYILREVEGAAEMTTVDHDEKTFSKTTLMTMQPEEAPFTYAKIARDTRTAMDEGAHIVQFDAVESRFRPMPITKTTGFGAFIQQRGLPLLNLGLSERPEPHTGTGFKLLLRMRGGKFFGGNKERVPNPNPPTNVHREWNIEADRRAVRSVLRDASPMVSWYDTTRLSSAVRLVSFREYFKDDNEKPAASSATRPEEIEGAALMPVFQAREFAKRVDVDLWMCPEDSIAIKMTDVANLLEIFEAEAPQPIRRLRAMMGVNMPSGFPVHGRIPIMFGLNLIATFAKLNVIEVPLDGSVFVVPEGYTDADEAQEEEQEEV